jgi:hypothetical protein
VYAAESFFNDISDAEASKLAQQCVAQNTAVQYQKVTHAPWKEVPTTYVFCLRDMAIMHNLQQAMVRDVEAIGGAGIIQTRTLDAGHCPFISMPDKLIEMVRDTWKSI